jgi:membrane associated rhomboid family serine protease
MSRRPALTWMLMAACILLFIARALPGWHAPELATKLLPGQLALWPFDSPRFRAWQLITYAFEHGSLLHLLLNLLGLWVFGSWLERALGSQRTLLIFLASILLAGVVQQSMSRWLGHATPIIGASGGIFGLLVAFARAFPDARLLVLPIPWPVKARTAACGFALLELCAALPLGWDWWRTMNSLFGNAAHFAHLGGMLGGLLFSVDRLELPASSQGAPPS